MKAEAVEGVEQSDSRFTLETESIVFGGQVGILQVREKKHFENDSAFSVVNN